MANLFETLMILCFGISWPVAIVKSLHSKTAKGKSLAFEFLIWVGYIFGITRKILQLSVPDANYDFIFYLGGLFYVLNFLCVTVDIILYLKYSKADREAEA